MNYAQIFKKHLELSLSKKDYFLIHDENIRYHLNRITDMNSKTFLEAFKLQSDEKYSGYRCQSNKCFIGLSMFQMNFNNPFEEIHIILDARCAQYPDVTQIIIERHLCIPLLYHHRDITVLLIDTVGDEDFEGGIQYGAERYCTSASQSHFCD